MADITAGRSAGTTANLTFDPTRPASAPGGARRLDPVPVVADVTAGRAAGTPWNAAKDPTRPVSPGDVRR